MQPLSHLGRDGPHEPLSPLSRDARASRDGPHATDPWTSSQSHLLKPTAHNPLPTAVPPPTSANAGTLGVRHVLCIIGLPERGKPYIARRLSAYLSFFHGAEVQVFNIVDYQRGPAGCDENAQGLLADLRKFMGRRNSAAAQNMPHLESRRAASLPPGEGAAEAAAAVAAVDGAPARPRGGSQAGLDLAAGGEPGAASAHPAALAGVLAAEAAEQAAAEYDNEQDKRFKNVDSGKVAIIMATDSNSCFYEKWSGTSKERRMWAQSTVHSDAQMGAKLIFIEVIVNHHVTTT